MYVLCSPRIEYLAPKYHRAELGKNVNVNVRKHLKVKIASFFIYLFIYLSAPMSHEQHELQ